MAKSGTLPGAGVVSEAPASAPAEERVGCRAEELRGCAGAWGALRGPGRAGAGPRWVGTWRSSSPVSRAFPAWVAFFSRSSRLMTLMTSASSRFLDGSPSQVLKIRYGWNEARGLERFTHGHSLQTPLPPDTPCPHLRREKPTQRASAKGRITHIISLNSFHNNNPVGRCAYECNYPGGQLLCVQGNPSVLGRSRELAPNIIFIL